LGSAHVWIHSSQSSEDTGSVWISSRADSYPPRVYAGGCEPGTPLSYINANIDSYDTLRSQLDLTPVLATLGSCKYLNVAFEHDYSVSTSDFLSDGPDEFTLEES
jgi:hypothetical protein